MYPITRLIKCSVKGLCPSVVYIENLQSNQGPNDHAVSFWQKYTCISFHYILTMFCMEIITMRIFGQFLTKRRTHIISSYFDYVLDGNHYHADFWSIFGKNTHAYHFIIFLMFFMEIIVEMGPPSISLRTSKS